MTEKSQAAPVKASTKMERRPKAAPKPRTAAERAAAIQAGESKPAPSAKVGDRAFDVKPVTFRLSGRARELLELARDEQLGQGRSATLTSALQDAIIATYGHLGEQK